MSASVVSSDSSLGPGPSPCVVIIGAGLAGSEAAWQAAQRGVRVILYEMRPIRLTPAHRTGAMAELVCSNSLGSNLPDRAMGLLKNELRRLGSLVIACADRTAVPAGDALAVDREAFSRAVTEAVETHPNVEVRREEVTDLAPWLEVGAPKGGRCLILATGPLTSSPLAESIRLLAGQEHLYFFDAMAPIVTADSVDMSVAFRANRWGERRSRAAGEEHGDYVNCPLTREQYYAFVDAVCSAERISLREFEQDEASRRYFEACLPIEVLAARSRDALAYGPMTPVGLRDPRTGKRPFAVVQLRQDDAAGTLLNLVGFQTNLTWTAQERVLRMIPGLEHADFVRFGQMHRNTFINSPALLRPTLQWHDRDDFFCAGQITGTEGYVGSVAGGWLAGVNAARIVKGLAPLTLPVTTMIGALFRYITTPSSTPFQPMKANFGLLPELAVPMRDKHHRHALLAARALADLDLALSAQGVEVVGPP